MIILPRTLFMPNCCVKINKYIADVQQDLKPNIRQLYPDGYSNLKLLNGEENEDGLHFLVLIFLDKFMTFKIKI